MRYIADTTEFQIEEPTIVTLGKFDGRHRGHQKLLRTMTVSYTHLDIPSHGERQGICYRGEGYAKGPQGFCVQDTPGPGETSL